jgi:hypothetical protein
MVMHDQDGNYVASGYRLANGIEIHNPAEVIEAWDQRTAYDSYDGKLSNMQFEPCFLTECMDNDAMIIAYAAEATGETLGGCYDIFNHICTSETLGPSVRQFCPLWCGVCETVTTVQLHMFDSFADGWNGAEWTITSDSGPFQKTGTLSSGAELIATFNLPSLDGIYTISVGCATWCGEISWELYYGDTLLASGGHSASSDFTLITAEPTPAPPATRAPTPAPTLALPATTVQLNMFDSFGDGWNGADWNITWDSGSFQEIGTMTTGSTDVALIDLPSLDGIYTISVGCTSWCGEISWELYHGDTLLASGGHSESSTFTLSTSAPTPAPTPVPTPTPAPTQSTTVQLNMFDSYGDGWNGADWTISWDSGSFQETGTLSSGSSGVATIDLPSTSGIYTISVGCASYCSEISWQLYSGDTLLASGGYSESSTFTLPQEPTPAPTPAISTTGTSVSTGTSTTDFTMTVTSVSGTSSTGTSVSGTSTTDSTMTDTSSTGTSFTTTATDTSETGRSCPIGGQTLSGEEKTMISLAGYRPVYCSTR